MLKFTARHMSSKRVNLAKLKPQTEEKPIKEDMQETVASPYFSPRRTRNKIKIENTDIPVKVEVQSLVSTHFPKIKKELIKREQLKSSATDIPNKKIKEEPRDDAESASLIPHIKTEPIDAIKTESDGIWEPPNWRQTLENIRFMRKERNAPVDTMGCHKCGDDMSDEKTKRYHILVALMLSSQTKDQTTYAAMDRLKGHGLTPANVVTSQVDTLEKLIYPVSFYKTKAKHVQKVAQILLDQYDSDIPATLNELMKLPGVGPKMAHICMHSAWNVLTGIGVDTHVHRISNRLGWVRKATKVPEHTRLALEQWLPSDLWLEINELLVGFGQTICSPTHPKCVGCINNQTCPASSVKAQREPLSKK